MDLNYIAANVVNAVTPRTNLTLLASTGYTTGTDGKQAPTYAAPVQAWGSVQSLTYKDIQQIESLNLQGTRRAIYLEGNWSGLERPSIKGGDLITFPVDASLGPYSGSTWLVAMVLEHWNDWSKVAVTLQNGS